MVTAAATSKYRKTTYNLERFIYRKPFINSYNNLCIDRYISYQILLEFVTIISYASYTAKRQLMHFDGKSDPPIDRNFMLA